MGIILRVPIIMVYYIRVYFGVPLFRETTKYRDVLRVQCPTTNGRITVRAGVLRSMCDCIPM